jgi:hypothetical protein
MNVFKELLKDAGNLVIDVSQEVASGIAALGLLPEKYEHDDDEVLP